MRNIYIVLCKSRRSLIYYVFSSTLLASCGEAMTERCELAALVLLQRWVNNWRFGAVLLC
ncbi:hypothetical protein [Nostoc sp.]